MKYFYSYYLVDTLSETIISGFSAISPEAARKMVYEAIKKNPVYKDMEDCLKLYCSHNLFDVAETFDEVLDPNYSHEVDLSGVFADA